MPPDGIIPTNTNPAPPVRARATLSVASQLNPDEHAATLDAAEKSGLTPAIVAAAKRSGTPEQQRRASGDWNELDEMLAASASYARWVSDPDNAAISQDDIGPLLGIARQVNKIKPRSAYDEIASSMAQGVSELEGSYYHLAAATGLMSPEEAATSGAEVSRRTARMRAQAGAGQVAYQRRLERATGFGKVGAALSDPTGFAGLVAESAAFSAPAIGLGALGALAAPALLPAAGVAALGGATAAGVAGSMAGAFAGGVFSEFGAWVDQAISESGYDMTDEASRLMAYRDPELMARVQGEALRKGITVAAIDALSMRFAGKAVAASAGKGFLRRAAGFGKELAQQSVQEAVGEAASQLAASGRVDVGESLLEGVASLGQSTSQITLGAFLRRSKRVVNDVAAGAAARNDAEALSGIAKTWRESKAAKRAPRRTANLVAAQLKDQDGELVAATFDREAWGAVWTAAGEDPGQALVDALPVTGRADYLRSEQTGEISLPMATYIETLGTVAEPLVQPLIMASRLRPAGLTLGEVSAFQALGVVDPGLDIDDVEEQLGDTVLFQDERELEAELAEVDLELDALAKVSAADSKVSVADTSDTSGRPGGQEVSAVSGAASAAQPAALAGDTTAVSQQPGEVPSPAPARERVAPPSAELLEAWIADQVEMGFKESEALAAADEAVRMGIDPTRSDDLNSLGEYVSATEAEAATAAPAAPTAQSPLAQLQQRRQEIAAKLTELRTARQAEQEFASGTPAVQPGFTRLYRGVGDASGTQVKTGIQYIDESEEILARNSVAGRWFTHERDVADSYPTNADAGAPRQTLYVDVPNAVYARIAGLADQPENIKQLSRNAASEVVLPPEYVAQARPLITGLAERTEADLRAAGRPAREAKMGGRLYSTMLSTLAQRSGIPVAELAARFPVTVRRGVEGEQAGDGTTLAQSAPLPDTIDVDGVQRPTTNSEGRPIHPTEDGVRAFWKWFGGSKVVDRNGRPAVQYHGTQSTDFNAFDLDSPSIFEDAQGVVFVTSSAELAADFAGRQFVTLDGATVTERFGAEGRVMPLYVQATDPLVVDYFGGTYSEEQVAGFVREARKGGHDSLVLRDMRDSPSGAQTPPRLSHVSVVFSPTQLKSSIGNRGTFDPTQPSILFQTAFHGGPHRFDKFDISKIGTGEGAQAYGHGLYFASKREVAEAYKHRLAPNKPALIRNASVPLNVLYIAQEVTEGLPSAQQRIQATIADSVAAALESRAASLREVAIDPDGAHADQSFDAGVAEQAAKAVRSGDIKITAAGTGALYTVDLAPAEDDYLLWDKPLSEQSEKVKKALIASGLAGREDIEGDPAGPENASLHDRFGVWMRKDLTGRAVYEAAAMKERSQERASKALLAAGIPGIKYLDGGSRSAGDGTFNYVLFDHNLVTITKLEQARRGATKFGQPDDSGTRAFTVEFYKDADASSFAHEMFHVYATMLGDIVASGAAPPALVAHYESARTFVGAEPGAPLTREQHEKLARGFEAYLRDGKAPTEGLRSMFAAFSAWLRRVYRTLRELDVELNDDIRDFYDRVLAADEALAESYEIGTDIIPAGALDAMEPEASERVLKAARDAADTATERLTRDVLKSREDQRQAEVDGRLDKIRTEVAAEVEAVPAVQARRAADAGTGPKLSRQWVEQHYGADSEEAKALRDMGLLSPDGLDGNDAAALLGYDHGDALVSELMDYQDIQGFIESEARQRLQERFPELAGTRAIRAAARKAKATAARAERLAVEVVELRKLASKAAKADEAALGEQASDAARAMEAGIRRAAFTPAETIAQIRQRAEMHLRSMQVGQIRPHAFLAAAGRESRRSADRVRVGDYQLAAEAKERELENLERFRIASKIVKRSAKWLARGRLLATDGYQKRAGLGGTSWRHQMNMLLNRFGLAAVRIDPDAKFDGLRDWLAGTAQKETGDLAPDIAPWILDESVRASWNSMTIERQQDVYNAFEQIYTVSNGLRMLKAGERGRSIADARADVAATITTSKAKLKTQTKAPDKDPWLRGALASHRAINSIAAQIDGRPGGPLWEHFVRPVRTAVENETEIGVELNGQLGEVYKLLSKDDRKAWLERRQIEGVRRTMSPMESFMVAIYYGSPKGRARLLNSFTADEVQLILGTLDARHAEMARMVWAAADSLWPAAKALWERNRGVAPEKVPALPFSTVGTDGQRIDWTGGYMHLAYGQLLSEEEMSVDELVQRFNAGTAIRVNTKAGAMIEQLEHVGHELRLDFSVVTSHLAEQIHLITHFEAMRDAQDVLNSPEVEAAFTERYGRTYFLQFRAAFKDIVGGDWATNDHMARGFGYLRAGVVISRLGLRAMTNLINLTGYTQSAVQLGHMSGKGSLDGSIRLARAMRKLMRSPHAFRDIAAWIYADDKTMAQRGNSFMREAHEQGRRIARPKSTRQAVQDWVMKVAFIPLAWTQRIVDVPLYMAAYELASEQQPEAGEETWRAIAADAVVQAQGGGHALDLPAIMRGNEWQRIWTTFMGFVVRTANLTSVAIAKVDKSNPVTIAHLAADLFALYWAPMALSWVLSRMLRGDDDDDDESALLAITINSLGMAMSGFALVREASGVTMGYFDYDGPVGASWVQSVGSLAAQLVQGEPDAGLMKAAFEVGGIGLQLPTGQLYDSLMGTAAWMEGDADMRAVFIGPPRKH